MYYRRLPKFEYLSPKSIEEACSMIDKFNSDARITAGGTIMIHRMKERVLAPKVLIGLKNIPELDSITFDPTAGLRIGALTKLESIASSPIVQEKYGILSKACTDFATPQIRNMGTIGGNIASKFPTAETVPVLIALGAQAKIVSGKTERMIPIEEVNKALTRTDLLTEIVIPSSSADKKWGYEKFAVREKLDYAIVSAAVVILSGSGTCEDCRIALGGVSSKRAKDAEEALKGKAITKDLIEKAAQKASQNAKTTSDIEFSAEYKKELFKVMVKRALQQALVA